jgi:anti-sigma regulatory factor (Ser/Thr protein kinase)
MEDISLHILDIAENSLNAGASNVAIRIRDDDREGIFSFEIRDDGKGIPCGLEEMAADPFYTTRSTRSVGLGLSLLAQAAQETGGSISIRCEEHGGTFVAATFRKHHIDMKPPGNIADTLLVLIIGNPDVDFRFIYNKNEKSFSLDTREIKDVLEGSPINSSPSISVIKQYLDEAFSDLGADVV